MTCDLSYTDPGTAETGSVETDPSLERPGPYSWLSGLDDIRAIARRRFRLVGAAPGARILVVGCGRGADVLALARLVRPGGRAFGVDLSEADLAAARRRAATAGLAAKFHHGAPDDLPFPDASFDGVCAAWLFAAIADPAPALAEMVRAVRLGGRVVIDETDWAAVSLETGHPDIVERVLRHNARQREPVRDERQLEHLARALNLVNLTTTTTSVVDRSGSTLRLFAEMANAAAASSEITAGDAARFKADLAQAVAERRFAATVPCITLAGERA